MFQTLGWCLSYMNFNELLTLIDKLDQSALAYVDYSHAGDHVILAKEVPFVHATGPSSNASSTNDQPVVRTTAEQRNEAVQSFSNTDSQDSATSTSVDVTPVMEAEVEGEAILSPMVGVAYLQAGPDVEPYVQVGDTVKQGDVVVIIEAMKLMNEIQAPKSGVVTEILIENESVVEFNQPLIRIK